MYYELQNARRIRAPTWMVAMGVVQVSLLNVGNSDGGVFELPPPPPFGCS